MAMHFSRHCLLAPTSRNSEHDVLSRSSFMSVQLNDAFSHALVRLSGTRVIVTAR